MKRKGGGADHFSPVFTPVLIVCFLVHLHIEEAENPGLNVPFRDEACDPPRIVRNHRNPGLPQGTVELCYPLLNSMGISIDENDECCFRLTTRAGSDFKTKSLSNPLFSTADTRRRPGKAHQVS